MSRRIPVVPQYRGGDPGAYLVSLVPVLQQALNLLAQGSGDTPYMVTSPTPARTLDGATATPDEVRAFVATLAADLQKTGDLN